MSESAPWYMKYGMKAAGVVTAILCCSLGIFAAISISAGCIVAGILLVVIGVAVMLLEAPICCALIPQLSRYNEFAEQRTAIQRAIFYGIAAILPLSMCFGISTIICGLALGGLCAFNVWRIVQQRRGRGQELPTQTGPVSGMDPQMGMAAPQPYSDPGHQPGGFREQLIEKAAVGAAKGIVSGGGGGAGGYSGF